MKLVPVREHVQKEIARWKQMRQHFGAIGRELNAESFRNRKIKTRSRRDVPVIDDANPISLRRRGAAYPLTVQNVVFTASLGCRVQLTDIVNVFFGVLGKETFPAAICRFLYPEVVVSFFESGQLVITGSRHPYDVVALLWMIAFRCRTHLGMHCTVSDLSIRNVNCSAAAGYKLDLELFHADYMSVTSYAPDVFPGLKFPINDPVLQRKFNGVTFLLFRSGRMVVTGAKVPVDAHRACRRLLGGLKNYDHSRPWRELEPALRRQIARHKTTKT